MSASVSYVIYLATCEEMPQGGSDDQFLKQALLSRGHTVHTVIWSDTTVDWSLATAVIIRTTWDYHHRLQEFITWAKSVQEVTLLLNPLEVLEWNYSKRYLVDIADRTSLKIIPSTITSDVNEAVQAIRTMIREGDVIVKPTISGSAELTYKLSALSIDDEGNQVIGINGKEQDPEEITKTILSQNLGKSEIIVQPFLQSIVDNGEVSVLFVQSPSNDTTQPCYELTHAVLKTVQRGDFRVQSDYGGKVELFDTADQNWQKIERFAWSVLESIKHLPPCLYARIDIVDWKSDTPKLGEIEVIEPEMFFRLSPDNKAGIAMAKGIEYSIERSSRNL